jgi:tRNA dimethylallyltransferase
MGLAVDRAELDQRIEARTAHMFAGGFVDEVTRLEQAGLREGRTASRALGYAQVLRVLAGEWELPHAQAETVTATRRFARRQEAWFRRDPRIRWLPAGDAARAELPARALALCREAAEQAPAQVSRPR